MSEMKKMLRFRFSTNVHFFYFLSFVLLDGGGIDGKHTNGQFSLQNQNNRLFFKHNNILIAYPKICFTCNGVSDKNID